MIESGVTFDLGQLVMDDEIARIIKYTVAGIAVTDETMAVDDIAKVGAFGDFRVARRDPQAHAGAEPDRPPRPSRTRGLGEQGRDRPCDAGALPGARVVESHQPLPLDPDVAEQFHRIIEQAADSEKGVA